MKLFKKLNQLKFKIANMEFKNNLDFTWNQHLFNLLKWSSEKCKNKIIIINLGKK